MPKISAIVITKNEESHITDCLTQLGWADELIVVDSFSGDQTVKLAEAAGAKVYQRPFLTFPRQRNAALAVATGEWVLFVDADERVTPSLRAEVRGTVTDAGQGVAGYWVPRRNIIWGNWVRHGGWYPDYQLRLLRRGRANYDEGREVHEVVTLEGNAGQLSESLVHYNYQGVRQFLAKQGQYSSLEARSMFRAGIRPRPHNYILQPLREAYRRFVKLNGYRDGLHGLTLATLLGYYCLVSYVKLRRLHKTPASLD